MKYDNNLTFCSSVMVLNNSQKSVFAENYDLTVEMTFDFLENVIISSY